LQYGADAGNATIRYNTDSVYIEDSTFGMANNKAIQFADSGGTYYTGLLLNATNTWTIVNNNGTGFSTVNSGSGGVYLGVAGSSIVQAYGSGFRPQTDNTYNLGTAAQRWATVYAGTGTINTSDAKTKQQVRSLSEAERAVAVRVKGLLRSFKFNDAVEKKGDNARIHFGVVAQDIQSAFESEGLDAHQYALFCYDEWEEQDEIRGDDGSLVQPHIPAGNRYGVRYEELLAFVLAAL
jgi:hypothetical protein